MQQYTEMGTTLIALGTFYLGLLAWLVSGSPRRARRPTLVQGAEALARRRR